MNFSGKRYEGWEKALLDYKRDMDNPALREKAYQVLDQMFYFIPVMFHIFDETHSSEFLLSCRHRYDFYIEVWDIDSHVDIMNFITKTISKQAQYFVLRMGREKGKYEDAITTYTSMSYDTVRYVNENGNISHHPIYEDIHETEPEYSPRETRLDTVYRSIRNRERSSEFDSDPEMRRLKSVITRYNLRISVFILMCKSPEAFLSNTTLVQKISYATDIPYSVLVSTLSSINSTNYARKNRQADMITKHQTWKICSQQKLSRCTEGTEQYETARRVINMHTRKVQEMRDRIDNAHVSQISNRNLAKLLGISRSIVESNVRHFRECQNMELF